LSGEEPIIEPEVEVSSTSSLAEEVLKLGERVSSIDERVSGLESRVEALEELFKGLASAVEASGRVAAAAALIGSWKASTCMFNREGVCVAWRIRSPEGFGESVVEVDGVLRLRVSEAPELCAFCPLYQARRGVRGGAGGEA